MAAQILRLSCTIIMCFGSLAGGTQRYALLVGAGEYPNAPRSALQGPANDVPAMQDVLIRNWQFKPANITVLLDRQATRANVLSALDKLADIVRQGDFVFFYYSGHGTSAWDPNTSDLALESHTGAIVPSDIRFGTASQVLPQLIVASRDLRPRLKRIDRKAQVFAAFDACYSGESIKSLFVSLPGLVAREVDLAPTATNERAAYMNEVRILAMEGAHGVEVEDAFPYTKLVYISASAKSERAWDITLDAAASGRRKTVDGKPHGAFTNALLEGLDGAADLNHDGVITYQELHQYLVETLVPAFGQFPQLLSNANDPRAVKQPVFGCSRAPFKAREQDRQTKLRVKLEVAPLGLLDLLVSNPRVEISERAYDLLVRRQIAAEPDRGVRHEDRYELRHASGTVIQTYGASESEALANRIQRQAALFDLINWKFRDQDFNVTLAIQPADREVFHLGEELTISMAPEQDCYLILIGIDVKGEITVNYPGWPEQAARVLRGRTAIAGPSRIEQPVGTEFLKLFAFRKKPDGFDAFIGKTFSPEDPQFQRLLRMIESSEGGRSETARIVFSIDQRQR